MTKKKDFRRSLKGRSGFDSKRRGGFFQKSLLDLISTGTQDWRSDVHDRYAASRDTDVSKRRSWAQERFSSFPPNTTSPETEDLTVEDLTVGTVSQRREWLHERRSEAGQDCYLLDYRKKDTDLTLDWSVLR